MVTVALILIQNLLETLHNRLALPEGNGIKH